jgi:O-methyltransferase
MIKKTRNCIRSLLVRGKQVIYMLAKATASMVGYHLKIKKKIRKPSYEHIFPRAIHAPWKSDKQFQSVYGAIKKYTKVDLYRCYELWQLVEESAKVPGALIEIGAWKGGTGALIAKKAALSEIDASVYICDTFEGIVKAGENDNYFKDGDLSDASAEEVEHLLNLFGVTKGKVLTGIFPEETAHKVTEEKIRFCHIDVDVYQSAKDIVDWLWPRLSVGGIVVYDDYGCGSCEGIVRYVQEEKTKNDRIVMHNLNGHAVIIKIK